MDTVFDLCVELLLLLAQLSGLTYKEINVWIFCIVWPLMTLAMAVWIYRLVRENKLLKSGLS